MCKKSSGPCNSPYPKITIKTSRRCWGSRTFMSSNSIRMSRFHIVPTRPRSTRAWSPIRVTTISGLSDASKVSRHIGLPHTGKIKDTRMFLRCRGSAMWRASSSWTSSTRINQGRGVERNITSIITRVMNPGITTFRSWTTWKATRTIPRSWVRAWLQEVDRALPPKWDV